ncbi:RES family NAD+ phosphorylase [soil metagenome]
MFRLSSEPYHQPKDAFSGLGAARWGGRWNGPGVSVVYTSASPSLAALERLVHTFSVRGLAGLWIYSVEVDERDSLYLPDDALPPEWDRVPVPPDWHAPPLKGTQLIGNDWCARNASLLLRVRSAVVLGEYNYLLNPAHPAFDAARLEPPEQFHFDERLTSLVGAFEARQG